MADVFHLQRHSCCCPLIHCCPLTLLFSDSDARGNTLHESGMRSPSVSRSLAEELEREVTQYKAASLFGEARLFHSF